MAKKIKPYKYGDAAPRSWHEAAQQLIEMQKRNKPSGNQKILDRLTAIEKEIRKKQDREEHSDGI